MGRGTSDKRCAVGGFVGLESADRILGDPLEYRTMHTRCGFEYAADLA